ncbi:uncharacterized protein FIBRA_03528 [Fibroporia radiculosa]|uniref:BolA protein n=1 Tax=Fibroporia radiculosa TaxID=599839 RepID=J4H2G3_9APHY|nr:uncharacterized protein FIBRA_03528 [Fibroporia radiculosa]CCM01474.1 predicted protein [Fibroporia radiculosa]
MSSFSSPVGSEGPVATSIRGKLMSALRPAEMQITNDSGQHRHHAAMKAQGGGNGETRRSFYPPSQFSTRRLPEVYDTLNRFADFTIQVVSEEFRGKTTMQRHRMIYSALAEEFSQGLHALSLKTKTPEEFEKSKAV